MPYVKRDAQGRIIARRRHGKALRQLAGQFGQGHFKNDRRQIDVPSRSDLTQAAIPIAQADRRLFSPDPGMPRTRFRNCKTLR